MTGGRMKKRWSVELDECAWRAIWQHCLYTWDIDEAEPPDVNTDSEYEARLKLTLALEQFIR